jgi:hypothetical protein
LDVAKLPGISIGLSDRQRRSIRLEGNARRLIYELLLPAGDLGAWLWSTAHKLPPPRSLQLTYPPERTDSPCGTVNLFYSRALCPSLPSRHDLEPSKAKLHTGCPVARIGTSGGKERCECRMLVKFPGSGPGLNHPLPRFPFTSRFATTFG